MLTLEDTTLQDALLRLAGELQQGRNGVIVEVELKGKPARLLLSLVKWDGERVLPSDE
jgi:hypothetical protein